VAERQGGPGILAIWNDCSAGREADFEKWYQHEHLAERLAVPGFRIGRRYEAVSGAPRYFAFYQTDSPEVLSSAAYLKRLDDPTPMTRRMMSEVFRNMIRTVCRQTLRLGGMRGASAVTVRFAEKPDHDALKGLSATMMQDRGVACAEVWTAASASEFPVSAEEKLRGGDGKIEACLMVETLRLPEAKKIAEALAGRFPAAAIGVYRLLCEVRSG